MTSLTAGYTALKERLKCLIPAAVLTKVRRAPKVYAPGHAPRAVPSSAILGDYAPLTHVGKDPRHKRFPITILPPQSDLLGRDQRALNEVASTWRMNRDDLRCIS